MSVKHPIIAVTGSSGAGTTTVMKSFSIFSGARTSTRRSSRATRFIATTGRHARGAEAGRARRRAQLQSLRPEANLLAELEALFASYGETGTGKLRRYVHDDAEAAQYKQMPGTFTPWEDSRPAPICCSTKDCTARP